MSYEDIDADTLVEEAVSNSLMFYDGGGVTLPGVRPQYNSQRKAGVLEKLQTRGIYCIGDKRNSSPAGEVFSVCGSAHHGLQAVQ